MSNKKNDGGPAFPGHGDEYIDTPDGLRRQSEYGMQGSAGMTLRDYFAAKAMEGMISGDTKMRGSELILSLPSHLGALSKTAYGIADAMLKAREE